MEYVAVAGLAMSVIGAVGSAAAQEKAAKNQSAIMGAQAQVQDQQAALMRKQADAQRMAAAQEAAHYNAQASEHETQAKLSEVQAINEQIRGEQAANHRMKVLAQDIGSSYANWAGNGLLVDGASGDTFGSILSNEAAEATEDVATIRDNTAMAMWTHQANAEVSRQSANHLKMAGKDAIRMGDLNAALTMRAAGIQGNQANITRLQARQVRKSAGDAWWGAAGQVGSSLFSFGSGITK